MHITLRQAKLLNLILDENTFKTMKYFGNILHVSNRTVHNDLNEMDSYLKTHHLQILKKQGSGIKVDKIDPFKEKEVRYELNKIITRENKTYLNDEKSREVYIVNELLIKGKILTYQKLSEELFSSFSLIKKDLNKIEELLDYSVKLSSDRNGTKIVGKEEDIQNVIKRYCYKVIAQNKKNIYDTEFNGVFLKSTINTARLIMDEVLDKFDEELSEQYKKSFYISLIIFIERIQHNFHIKKSYSKSEQNLENVFLNYPYAVEISNQIEHQLDTHLMDNDITYIAILLFGHKLELKLDQSFIEDLLVKDIKEIILKVSQSMDIDLTSDYKLLDSLIVHVYALIYRLKNEIEINNPLIEKIKNDYAVLFQMIWYAFEDFEKKYNVRLSEDEIAFITIYFQAAISRKTDIKRVLIVCQTGIVTSELIMDRVKNFLPKNIYFRIISKPNLTVDALENIDFIISSIQLEKEIKLPIVYVSSLITDDDLINIYTFYLKYSDTEFKPNKRIVNFDNEKYINMIDLNYIEFAPDNITNKRDCLNFMISRLEKNNIVTEKFRESVFDRENLGNSIVQKNIAIPHGITSEVKQSKISILLFKNPIKWEGELKVSLVILLSITENEISKTRELLSRFYKSIINDKEKTNKISKISSKNEIVEYFVP